MIFRFITLIRLIYGLISSFTIHANIALPTLSSMSQIRFTMFNDNCKNTGIYAQPVTEWGVNESLYQSTEVPCCLNGGRDVESIIFSHGTPARHLLHRCTRRRTLLWTPGAGTGDRAGNGAQKRHWVGHWESWVGHSAKWCQPWTGVKTSPMFIALVSTRGLLPETSTQELGDNNKWTIPMHNMN